MMTTVVDVARWLDQFAPRSLAEPWDNVGLLWGDPEATVSRVMTCLTVTSATAGEAIDERVELIVSHHPVLFKAVKTIRADHPENGILWDLARAGVAIASPHTAFDNTAGGINDGLARCLALRDIGPLRPAPGLGAFKVVVFAPRESRQAILSGAFAAGAGKIGAYDECSFTGRGHGTFFGGEGANPAVGRVGRREEVRESRIEFLCLADRLEAVLGAIRAKHSYEEPAIDVYPLHPQTHGPGVGRVGRLSEPTTLKQFAESVSLALGSSAVQFAGPASRRVERVAIVCGAGDDFLSDAARAGADVLLTGEARFHRALEAGALGIGLVIAGHHATERPGVEDLAGRIADAFPSLDVWASRLEGDPWQSLA